MKKKRNKNLIILIWIVVGLLILLAAEFIYLSKKSDDVVLPEYYKNLSQQCSTQPASSCCLASINTMSEGGFELATGSSCPAGFKSNILKCEDSLTWCEPAE